MIELLEKKAISTGLKQRALSAATTQEANARTFAAQQRTKAKNVGLVDTVLGKKRTLLNSATEADQLAARRKRQMGVFGKKEPGFLSRLMDKMKSKNKSSIELNKLTLDAINKYRLEKKAVSPELKLRAFQKAQLDQSAATTQSSRLRETAGKMNLWDRILGRKRKVLNQADYFDSIANKRARQAGIFKAPPPVEKPPLFDRFSKSWNTGVDKTFGFIDKHPVGSAVGAAGLLGLGAYGVKKYFDRDKDKDEQKYASYFVKDATSRRKLKAAYKESWNKVNVLGNLANKADKQRNGLWGLFRSDKDKIESNYALGQVADAVKQNKYFGEKLNQANKTHNKHLLYGGLALAGAGGIAYGVKKYLDYKKKNNEEKTASDLYKIAVSDALIARAMVASKLKAAKNRILARKSLRDANNVKASVKPFESYAENPKIKLQNDANKLEQIAKRKDSQHNYFYESLKKRDSSHPAIQQENTSRANIARSSGVKVPTSTTSNTTDTNKKSNFGRNVLIGGGIAATAGLGYALGRSNKDDDDTKKAPVYNTVIKR